MIKPNKDALQQIILMDIDDIESLIKALKLPMLNNILFIIISLGKNGVFSRCHDQFYQVTIPKINVVNPVGSGDVTLVALAVSLH